MGCFESWLARSETCWPAYFVTIAPTSFGTGNQLSEHPNQLSARPANLPSIAIGQLYISLSRPIGPLHVMSATLKNSHEILKYLIRHLSEIGKRIWPKKSSKTHNPSTLFFYGHQGTIQGLWPIVRRSPTPLRLSVAITIRYDLFWICLYGD